VEEFDGCSRAKHFAVAKRIANAAQRKALAAEIAKRPKRRCGRPRSQRRFR
jgi:hypothetical protein